MKIKAINPHFSVDHGFDGTLTLKFRGVGPHVEDREIEVQFDPVRSLPFLSRLVQHAIYAQQNAVDALVVGPCRKCKNARMIDGKHCSCVAKYRGEYPAQDTFSAERLQRIRRATFPLRNTERAFTDDYVIEVQFEDISFAGQDITITTLEPDEAGDTEDG